MFPRDRDVMRLKVQSFTLGEFLEQYAPGYRLPRFDQVQALVQPHCHHKAVLGFDSDETVLATTGLRFQVLQSGCCGMAGSFGFERSHYDISMKIGERGLLPAVRKADATTVIIADGFSCRTQIEQATGRKPLHLAQVLRMRESG